MQDAATVTFASTVPVWKYEKALGICSDTATFLQARLKGGVSVRFRQEETPLFICGDKVMALVAEFAWKGEVFAEVRTTFQGDTRELLVIDRYHRDQKKCFSTCNEAIEFMITRLKAHGKEKFEELQYLGRDAEFLAGL